MRKSLLAVLCVALVASSAFVTGTLIDSPHAGATVADSYFQCWQSYTQCVSDCQSFSEPTRSQCEYWCYSTHWCAQV